MAGMFRDPNIIPAFLIMLVIGSFFVYHNWTNQDDGYINTPHGAINYIFEVEYADGSVRFVDPNVENTTFSLFDQETEKQVEEIRLALLYENTKPNTYKIEGWNLLYTIEFSSDVYDRNDGVFLVRPFTEGAEATDNPEAYPQYYAYKPIGETDDTPFYFKVDLDNASNLFPMHDPLGLINQVHDPSEIKNITVHPFMFCFDDGDAALTNLIGELNTGESTTIEVKFSYDFFKDEDLTANKIEGEFGWQVTTFEITLRKVTTSGDFTINLGSVENG